MANANLGQIRDEVELCFSVPSGNSYVDSAEEAQDINRAYEKTAYAYAWPQMLLRTGIVITANVDRYPLPSQFRKAYYIKVKGQRYDETELDIIKDSRKKFAIDRNASQLILSQTPDTASTAYTLSNAESAGAAVTIELNTVSGLSQLDEIFVDSASGTDEFTLVSSVSTSATTITARLRAAKSASDILYRLKEIIDVYHYRTITLLSGSTDVTILPDETDLTIAHLAASYAYTRLEEFTKAKEHYAIWERDTKAAWLAHDLNSANGAGQFVIA